VSELALVDCPTRTPADLAPGFRLRRVGGKLFLRRERPLLDPCQPRVAESRGYMLDQIVILGVIVPLEQRREHLIGQFAGVGFCRLGQRPQRGAAFPKHIGLAQEKWRDFI